MKYYGNKGILNKLIALILLLLCTQLSYAAHSHDVDDLSFESCATCLMAENIELDDVILSPSTKFISPEFTSVESLAITFLELSKNRSRVLYLRGPPA